MLKRIFTWRKLPSQDFTYGAVGCPFPSVIERVSPALHWRGRAGRRGAEEVASGWGLRAVNNAQVIRLSFLWRVVTCVGTLDAFGSGALVNIHKDPLFPHANDM